MTQRRSHEIKVVTFLAYFSCVCVDLLAGSIENVRFRSSGERYGWLTLHYTIKCSLKWESPSTWNQRASCQWNKVYILYVYICTSTSCHMTRGLPAMWPFSGSDYNAIKRLIYSVSLSSKESMGDFFVLLQLDFLLSGHKQYWWDQSIAFVYIAIYEPRLRLWTFRDIDWWTCSIVYVNILSYTCLQAN